MKFMRKNWLIALLLTLTVCLGLSACDLGDLPDDTTGILGTADVLGTTAEAVTDTLTEEPAESETAPEEPDESETVPEEPDESETVPEEPDESAEEPTDEPTEVPSSAPDEPTDKPTDEPTDESVSKPEEPTEKPAEPTEPEVPALTMPAFKVSDVPAYDKDPYCVVNGNVPFFTANQLTADSYEFYSPLDSLGRCGTVVASIGRDLMPTSDRGNISSVRPTGWHSVSYPTLGIDSLYNRSHLIAFQLTGENANRENLISGTRYMNQTVMTQFENMVADYIKETGNHVMYRVTPVFTGNNLIADGVLMEAWSVEDEGEGVCFCVYLYNVQPGILIDYATGESELVGIELPEGSPNYILNTNSKKFHKPTCSNAETISDKNRKESYETREELIAQGYSSAGCCKP